ncbi:hypothetical protein R3P38DRAFT_693587 [Favolaschia claudopus]|uniref:Decapping nuclease n=1 Tax=Favolaschia claudopus TaxID=2862362 RepID=A0AAW0EDL0_9AGAR
MRPLDLTITRVVCTLAPPPLVHKKILSPPIVIAKNRTKINDSFLLLSSLSPELGGARKAWLGPAHQVARYALEESETGAKVSLDLARAMRRFSQPARRANIRKLGRLGHPYFSLKPHLREMLGACMLTPKGVSHLFQADVVAERDVINKLMLPHSASFNVSFAHGVLFLENAEVPTRLETRGVETKIGFHRACTEMYHRRPPVPDTRSRHTFHAVVARQLGGLNLLMSGPVDCVETNYTGSPRCYVSLVTRPLQDGKFRIRPNIWKEWYFRAHLMGIRSLFLGVVDEDGVLRHCRNLATRVLPRAAAVDGVQWDPEENMRWAGRVLGALRDYCQEAADLAEVANKRWSPKTALWRVEIRPLGEELRVLVRPLTTKERRGKVLVPRAVLEAFRRNSGMPV